MNRDYERNLCLKHPKGCFFCCLELVEETVILNCVDISVSMLEAIYNVHNDWYRLQLGKMDVST